MPLNATRPLTSTAARSAMASTLSAWCSTMTRLARVVSRATAPRTSWTIAGASPSNGSSRRMIRLGTIRARAIATICRSPPDSVSARERISTRSFGNRSATSSCEAPSRRAASRRFSCTVRFGNRRRPSGTSEMPSRLIWSGRSAVMSRPSRTIRPAWAGSVPVTVRSSVVLPTPLRPSSAVTSPGNTERLTPSSTVPPP